VVTHTCVNNTTVGIGQPCAATSECVSPLFCADATVLGSKVLPIATKGMCTAPCCTSSTCDNNFVCYAPGSGGHFCVDPAKIGRSTPGADAPGATDTTATRCRSGELQNGRCIDTCCSDSDCTNGTSCAYGTLDGHSGYFCQPNTGSGQDGDVCFAQTDCHDYVCAYNTCYANCCKTSNCPGYACVAVKYNQSPDSVPLCAQNMLGAGGIGTPCTNNTTCASNYCYDDLVKSQQYCSDSCCVDADCGGGYVCRPTPQFLHCIKS
jgi:hypothetical protein